MFKIFKTQKFWDIVAYAVSTVVGITIFFKATPELISTTTSVGAQHFIKFTIAFWCAFLTLCIEKGIVYWIKSNELYEKLNELKHVFEITGVAASQGICLFTDDKKSPVAELLALDKYSAFGYAITKKSFNKMIDKGIALVESTLSEYTVELKNAIEQTNDSLFMCCIVPPAWFFAKDDEYLPPSEKFPPAKMLDLNQKKKSLAEYQDAKITTKIRVVVFDDNDTGKLSTSDYKNAAVGLNSINKGFKHYWTHEKLIAIYNKIVLKKENEINVKDYVIFDGKYFLQYDLKAEILRVGWHSPALTRNMNLFNTETIRYLGTEKLLFENYDELIKRMGQPI